MKRRLFWAGVALLIGGAITVRLLYHPLEDAHEQMHAREAEAQAAIEAFAKLLTEQQLRALETHPSRE